jgi:hypothetical protein
MRFMMVIFRENYVSDKPAEIKDRAAFEEMGKYNDQLKKAGILLAMDGLTPPSMGARLTYKDGKPKIKDGPFTEAKEVVGSFWIIDVKSREEAIEGASRIPGSGDEMVEVRRFFDASDFDPDRGKKFEKQFARDEYTAGNRR